MDFSVENSFFWNEKGEKEKYNDWEWYAQAHQAVNFIENTEGEPFALFLSWHPPHNWAGMNGYGAPEDMLSLYDPEILELRPGCKDTPEVRKMYQGYMALCTSVDKAFGWLMDALEEKGIRDETLVVVMNVRGFQTANPVEVDLAVLGGNPSRYVNLADGREWLVTNQKLELKYLGEYEIWVGTLSD